MNKIKEEDYTTLFFYNNENILVNKSDRRIAFRGKIDSLISSFIEAEIKIIDLNENILSLYLKECSNYIKEISEAEALNILPKEINLFSLDENTIHKISHNPKIYIGINHLFNINSSMPRSVIILNKLRVEIREVEILCVDAINNIDISKEYNNDSKKILKTIQMNLNRLSSAIYILMCLYASNKKSIEQIKLF